MRFDNSMARRLAFALVIAGGIAAAVASVTAQAPGPVLLVLDQSAIDYGDATHLIPVAASNQTMATVGLREQLPFFSARLGESVSLPSGATASDGWFALRSAPSSWASADGAGDGLENFFVASAGLGSPDDNDDRTSLLGAVAGVTPLRAAGLNMLIGRQVCAVLYDGEIAPAAAGGSTTSLAGANLGIVAFQVTGVGTAGTEWPAVTVELLNVRKTCNGTLAAFSEAPENP